jgi:predicted DCC family thiol-disulfide oxidoreductase YuxK
MKIIFFDGYCGLCNGFVNFIMRVDRKGLFKFSPLQSDFAKAKLSVEDTQDLKSVVVLIDEVTYRKARGVFMALRELGLFWKCLSFLRFLPAGLLNFSYDFIAENRYRLFGKRETCRLPSPAERERFIV